jgi:acyl carrier protein
MTRDELKQVVLHTLRTVAPETDPAEIQMDKAIRVQLDIDSMDALNFFIRLHDKLGVEIPEADYARLTTVNECVTYLGAKLG